MKQNKFPPGWDAERVKSVIDYYENQTEDEAVAEDEKAFRHEFITNVEVPTQLVYAVNDQEQQIGTKIWSLRFSVDPSAFSDFKERVSWSGKLETSSAFYGPNNLMKQNRENA